MNPSLSTVDSLFSTLQHVSTSAAAAATNGSRLNSVDLVVVDAAAKSRASPSFNDAEPPSYYEVVGAMMSEQQQRTATLSVQNGSGANRPYSMMTTVNMRQPIGQHNRPTTIPALNNKEFTAINTCSGSIIGNNNNRTTRNLNLAGSIYHQQDQHENRSQGASTTVGCLPHHQQQQHQSDQVISMRDSPSSSSTTTTTTTTAAGSHHQQHSGRRRPPSDTHHHHHHHHSRNASSSSSSYHGGQLAKPSETYMLWSVFTMFYCIFVGLCALVLSLLVRHYNRKGLYDKAYASSRAAWYLNIAGLFFGIVFLAAVIICLFLWPR